MDDRMKRILELAIRAPSTHNSQPWLFKVGGNKIEIFYNPKYVLPYADKETRDLHISIGCLLENLRLAAIANKMKPDLSFGPFLEKTKLAEVSLREVGDLVDELSQTLIRTIPMRVNARGIFTKEKVPQGILEKIRSFNGNDSIFISFLEREREIKTVAQATAKAIIDAYNEVSFRKEMSHWMNNNLSRKKEGLPGYSLKMPLLVSLVIPWLIRYFNMGKFLSKLNVKSISSSPLVVVVSGDDGPVPWMNTGMLAERMMLYIQSCGFQTSIYVGSIEIGDNYQEIQKLTNLNKRPQFIFAAGRIPGEHRITPRHKLEDKIIK